MSDRATLSTKRPGRPTETAEFGQMVRRMVKAYARRVGELADVESLAGLCALRTEIDQATNTAAQALHGAGYSWTEIAAVLGITRQSARERFSG